MDRCGDHHSGNVRRWHRHVRCVGAVSVSLSLLGSFVGGMAHLHPFGATSEEAAPGATLHRCPIAIPVAGYLH